MKTLAFLTVGAAALLATSFLFGPAPRLGEARDEEGDEASDEATDPHGVELAQKMWEGRCQRCHTVPDATFETGRAFLAQITETS